MADYNLKNINDLFYKKMKIFAAQNSITIKELILNAVDKEMENNGECFNREAKRGKKKIL